MLILHIFRFFQAFVFASPIWYLSSSLVSCTLRASPLILTLHTPPGEYYCKAASWFPYYTRFSNYDVATMVVKAGRPRIFRSRHGSHFCFRRVTHEISQITSFLSSLHWTGFKIWHSVLKNVCSLHFSEERFCFSQGSSSQRTVNTLSPLQQPVSDCYIGR